MSLSETICFSEQNSDQHFRWTLVESCLGLPSRLKNSSGKLEVLGIFPYFVLHFHYVYLIINLLINVSCNLQNQCFWKIKIPCTKECMYVQFWIRKILIGLDLRTWSLSTSNAQKGEEIWNNRNSWEKIKDEFALPCSFFIVNPFWTGLRIFKQEFRTLRESKRVSWKGDSKLL